VGEILRFGLQLSDRQLGVIWLKYAP